MANAPLERIVQKTTIQGEKKRKKERQYGSTGFHLQRGIWFARNDKPAELTGHDKRKRGDGGIVARVSPLQGPRPLLQPRCTVQPVAGSVGSGKCVVECSTPVAQDGEIAKGLAGCFTVAMAVVVAQNRKQHDKGVHADRCSPGKERNGRQDP